VSPTLSRPGTVTFRNACSTYVALSQLTTDEASFVLTGAPMADLTRLQVPAAARDSSGAWVDGTAVADLEFRPTVLGQRTGQLKAVTSLSTQPSLSVRLRGVGGGPRIEVRPTPLLVGRIGFSPGASPAINVVRTLRIANVGNRPMPADPRANLKLGAMGQGTMYWRVRSISGTDAELCVGEWDVMRNGCLGGLAPLRYDPNFGIEALPGAAMNLPVRIIPATAGPKEWEVTFLSNDTLNPEVTVRITAEAVEAPPCNYEVRPGQLSFGVIDQPQMRDLTFSLRNRGVQPADLCYFNGIELTPTSDDTFSLPLGAIGSLVVPPGTEVPITVRAMPLRPSPMSPVVARGEATFSVNTPGATRGSVILTATLAPACITITPSPITFANTELECGSPEQSLTIANTCSTALTLNTITVTNAALAPTGTGSCSSAAGCPQFAISGLPTLGALAPGATRQVRVRFRPFSLGPTVGELGVTVQQNGSAITYPVALSGTGVARTAMGCGVTALCPAAVTVGANSTVTLNTTVMASGPTTCAWAVGMRPTTSSGNFAAPASCTSTTYFADVVGTHVVNFNVNDGLGGTAQCSTPITVTPNGDLWVELTWNRNFDIDLHLLHPSAGNPTVASSWMNRPWDCYFANRTPTWGSTQTSPSLDRDDTTGTGPENTRINTPQPGVTYTIGVHVYGGTIGAGVTSTVKLYCGGSLVTTQTRFQNASKDMWVVGDVVFGTVSPCQFTPSNVVVPNVF